MFFYKNSCVKENKEVSFCNSVINRLAHYSNILVEQSEFITDNGIKDFSLLNSSREIQLIDNGNHKSFI